jgi:hypothetical protein
MTSQTNIHICDNVEPMMGVGIYHYRAYGEEHPLWMIPKQGENYKDMDYMQDADLLELKEFTGSLNRDEFK